MRRYAAPSGVRAVAAWLGALALTALVIVPALRERREEIPALIAAMALRSAEHLIESRREMAVAA